jgi:hypothetical protein
LFCFKAFLETKGTKRTNTKEFMVLTLVVICLQSPWIRSEEVNWKGPNMTCQKGQRAEDVA